MGNLIHRLNKCAILLVVLVLLTVLLSSIGHAREPDLSSLLPEQQVDYDELRAFMGQAIVNAIGGYLAGDFDYSLTPTGDELFDRYAQAVEERFAAATSEDVASLDSFGALPDSLLAEWESEFGDRPEYWELRYFCADSLSEPQYADPERFSSPVDFLEHARSSGFASGNTLLLLYLEDQYAWSQVLDELTPYEGYKAPPYFSDEEYRLPERASVSIDERESYQAVQAEADLHLATLLDEAIQLDQGLAWAYYFRSKYLMNLGEYELALADLALGNEQPVYTYPVPYPLTVVFSNLVDGSATGSKSVSGAVLQMYLSWPLPHFISIKEFNKEALAIAAWSGDIHLADECLDFSCRLAGATPGTYISSLVGVVNVGLITHYLDEEYGCSLPPEQLETVNRLNGAKYHVQEAIKNDRQIPDIIEEMAESIAWHQSRALPLACFAAGEGECQLVQQHLHVFDDIASVDLTTLALTDEIAMYEALSYDEEKFRASIRRAAKSISRFVQFEAMTPHQQDQELKRLELINRLAETMPMPESR